MISSTALDLPLHRKEVMDACLGQGLQPRMMEHLPAADADAIRESLRLVDEADVYVGIIAHRYGYVPMPHNISITEMEYKRAVERRIPRLIFLMHDDHPVKLADVERGEGASLLEAFKLRLQTEQVVAFFKSPEDLRAQVIHSLIPYRPTTGASAQNPALGEQKANYLQRLAETCRWIDLGGLAPQVGGELLRLPLDAVFVHLHAERDIPLREDFTREEFRLRRELEDQGAPAEEVRRRIDYLAARALQSIESDAPARKQRVEVTEALKQPRIAVLGDPGAGKTTLLRYLARAAAVREPGLAATIGADLLPVYVRLGEYDQFCTRQHQISLMEYALRAAGTRELPLSKELLAAEAKHGRCLFLLDGLDEVVHAGQRGTIRDRIEELARTHRNCRLVVTSRIVGYRDAQLPRGDDGFAHFTLSPFDDANIARFAERWYDAIRTTGDLTDPARQNAQALVQGIHYFPGVRRLAANPLLMTLIALIYWREVRLPRRRIELYASAVKMLLTKWVQKRTPDLRLSEREAMSLLMAVAFHVHETSGAGLITRPELVRLLENLKTDPERGGLSEAAAQKEVEEFLGVQGEHVGLLYPRGFDDRGREVFGFLHLTFEEYCAGRELARRWKQGKLKLTNYLHRPRWEEPILLACAHLSDEDDYHAVDNFVREILEAESPYEKQLHRDLLLAGRCLADEANVSRELRQRILGGLDQAFTTSITPLNERIQATFAAMRGSRVAEDAVTLLLAKLSAENQHVCSAVARALRSLGAAARPEVLDALLRLLDDYDARARSAAAGALGGLEEAAARPEVFDALFRLLNDSDGPVRDEAAAALGRLGAASPEVVAALLRRLDDNDFLVRYAAAEALGRLGAAGRPEVLDALLRLLDDDVDWVRSAAARALGRQGASASPEVVAALLRRLDDYSILVRSAAAEALGRLGAAGRPEVLDALLLLLDDNYGPAVRSAAAAALESMGAAGALEGLGAAARPEVLDALLRYLDHDQSSVRSAAAAVLGGAAARPEVLDALLRRLDDDVDWVRSAAAGALGRLGTATSPEVLAALLRRLDDDYESVRSAVAGALGGLGEAAARLEVLDALLRRLDDNASDVRSAVAGALASLGEVAATRVVLDRLAEAASISWEDAAFRALARLTPHYRPSPVVVLPNVASPDARLAEPNGRTG
jgi:HEAT repeat protein